MGKKKLGRLQQPGGMKTGLLWTPRSPNTTAHLWSAHILPSVQSHRVSAALMKHCISIIHFPLTISPDVLFVVRIVLKYSWYQWTYGRTNIQCRSSSFAHSPLLKLQRWQKFLVARQGPHQWRVPLRQVDRMQIECFAVVCVQECSKTWIKKRIPLFTSW